MQRLVGREWATMRDKGETRHRRPPGIHVGKKRERSGPTVNLGTYVGRQLETVGQWWEKGKHGGTTGDKGRQDFGKAAKPSNKGKPEQRQSERRAHKTLGMHMGHPHVGEWGGQRKKRTYKTPGRRRKLYFRVKQPTRVSFFLSH